MALVLAADAGAGLVPGIGVELVAVVAAAADAGITAAGVITGAGVGTRVGLAAAGEDPCADFVSV